MGFNVQDTKYMVRAFMKDGSYFNITDGITSLSWQDPAEEIAQRATLTVAQVKTPKGYLNALLPLCTQIIIFANNQAVFQGIIWEWEYVSGTNREIELVCYDYFIYAERSKSYAYFPAGKSTKDIITSICTTNGIKLQYEYDGIKHAKTLFKGNTISDQILTTLDDAKKKSKVEPIAIFDKQVLIVRKKGANKDVYVFNGAKNAAISTTERLTMDDLVTKVTVYGKEDDEGRRKIETTVTGKTQYGNLVDFVTRDSDDTLAAAKEEAEKIIADQGEPTRYIAVEAPDVPFIRKGDKVKMSAGSLVGYFYVKGVSHNAQNRGMTMELERVK